MHGDHLGSASLISTNAGVTSGQLRYEPYGQRRVASGNIWTEYTFTDQRQELSVGLMDYDARMYSPLLAQFISPDSIVPDDESVQDWNRYGYVQHNPLKFVDPTGHTYQQYWMYGYSYRVYSSGASGGGSYRASGTSSAAAPSSAARAPAGSQPSAAQTAAGQQAIAQRPATLRQSVNAQPNEQAHHLIPKAHENHNFVQRAKNAGWDHQGPQNGMALKNNQADALAAGQPYHRGSHPTYNGQVRRELDLLNQAAIKNNWTDQHAHKVLNNLAQHHRNQITKMSPGKRLE